MKYSIYVSLILFIFIQCDKDEEIAKADLLGTWELVEENIVYEELSVQFDEDESFTITEMIKKMPEPDTLNTSGDDAVFGFTSDNLYTESDFDEHGNLLPQAVGTVQPGDIKYIEYPDYGTWDLDNTILTLFSADVRIELCKNGTNKQHVRLSATIDCSKNEKYYLSPFRITIWTISQLTKDKLVVIQAFVNPANTDNFDYTIISLQKVN